MSADLPADQARDGAGPGGPPQPDPGWLTAPERRAWLALTGLVVKLPSTLDGQLQRDAGLTFFEYLVLAMLSEATDRRLRMSQLSVLTGGSLSRLSHVAKRLESAGFLARSADPRDRRATLATLTPAGWAKVVATAPGHVASVRALIIDALSPEQVCQVAAIGDAILARIDPEGTARPPG